VGQPLGLGQLFSTVLDGLEPELLLGDVQAVADQNGRVPCPRGRHDLSARVSPAHLVGGEHETELEVEPLPRVDAAKELAPEALEIFRMHLQPPFATSTPPDAAFLTLRAYGPLCRFEQDRSPTVGDEEWGESPVRVARAGARPGPRGATVCAGARAACDAARDPRCWRVRPRPPGDGALAFPLLSGQAMRSPTSPPDLTTLSPPELDRASGGADVRAPLGGDVNQQINTNWGGTQVINPPQQKTPATRTEYLRQNPEARWGPPPFKPKPIRR
jgi:hypothetical protein